MEVESSALPARISRAPFVFFRLGETSAVELKSLLEGRIEHIQESRIDLILPFTGKTRPSSIAEIELLSRVPVAESIETEDLFDGSEFDPDQVAALLNEGALTYRGDPRWRGRNSIAWDSIASIFHASCLFEAPDSGRSTDLDIDDCERDAKEKTQSYIDLHGPPPPPRLQYRHDDRTTGADFKGSIDLPIESADEDLFLRLLSRRRTCRHFRNASIRFRQLSTLLRWSFGVQALVELGESYVVPLKSSPSGGSTHPIEAFPIVCNVAGLRPGVYHYDAFGHSLEPIQIAPQDKVRGLISRLASGQKFAGTAAVAVLLVARLGRNYWKYPRRSRTYSVIHQDAGHLSQTFYLTAEHLGLGAFYTAAIAGEVARSELGVDDSIDGPIGLCGCGYRDEIKDGFLKVQPFTPGKSSVRLPVEVRSPIARHGSPSLDECTDTLSSSSDLWNIRLSPPFDEQ